MRRYNSLYYFLIVLLVMGAFASMAQNSYGLKIIGAVSIAFGLLFFLQLIENLRAKNHQPASIPIELVALTLLSFLFPLRLFHITFPYLPWILGVTGVVLLFVYVQRMIQRVRLFQGKNKLLGLLLLVFHAGIILFIITLMVISSLPRLAVYTGVVAFIVLILFAVTGFIKRQLPVDGENFSALSIISNFKDQSLLLVSLFFIFMLYFGFTATGILPRLYSDDYPQAYFELVNKAELGKEKPVDGRYKHEEFKEGYDEFLTRNKIKGGN